MRLKNKKTGEIVNAMEVDLYTDVVYLKISKDGRYDSREYSSLAELNEEWEDAPEEPKEYWFLSGRGEVKCIEDENTVFDKDHKFIGNYFETEEEAEQAVEKLKAWKRLKDKGFRFLPDASFIQQKNEVGESIGSISFTMDNEDDYIWGNNKDLEILFGGEE